MKKIVLTAAIALAAFSGVQAQSIANNETPGTQDDVTLIGNLGIVDMIDLVPEFQVAGNSADTWMEFENGLSLIEAWPNTPPGGSDIEFRISATRHFHVAVKGATFARIGGGDPGITADKFKMTVYNYGSIPGGAAENGFGGSGSTLSNSYQDFLQGNGCYNKLFVCNLTLLPQAAYNHLGGTYSANLSYRATLAP